MSPIFCLQRWRLALAILMVASMFLGRAMAQPPVTAEKKVQQALCRLSGEVAQKIHSLNKTLERRPEKLSPSRWSSIAAGAKEVKISVSRLKTIQEEVQEAVNGISEASGRMRTGLAKLEANFRDLAAEAQKQADGTGGDAPLPPLLLPLVRREVDVYTKGAAACNSTAKTFAAVLSDTKEKMALVQRCRPSLDRMEKAAENFLELAKIGEDLDQAKETLDTFANQINAVLDLLENLATSTQKAIGNLPPQGVGLPVTALPTASRPLPIIEQAMITSDTSPAQPSPNISTLSPAVTVEDVEALRKEIQTLAKSLEKRICTLEQKMDVLEGKYDRPEAAPPIKSVQPIPRPVPVGATKPNPLLADTAESHYRAGQQAQAQGNLAAAVQEFRAALAAHRGDPDDAAPFRLALASALLAQ